MTESAAAPSAATPLPSGDSEVLPKIFDAYRRCALGDGDALKSTLTDRAAVAVSEWVAIRNGCPVGSHRIVAFLRETPDWPASALLRRRAEEMFVADRRPPAAVRAFFAEQAPLTPSGRLALAEALRAEGRDPEAAALVRRVWREDPLSKAAESRILDLFPNVLAEADHRFRMERQLLKENWAAAQRAAERAGKDHVLLAKARIAVAQRSRKAEAALAAVPSALRSDTSYLFSRALFLRGKDKFVEAAQVMAQAPRDPDVLTDGDEWWNERRLIARKLLDRGAFRAAYEVASQHAAQANVNRIEAEFHAGWIALRFLEDPAAAAAHFAAAGNIAETPISVARAAYWQGRAAEAAGAANDARVHYTRAADRAITFYGQLALEKLGRDTLELRRPAPADEAARAAFQALTPVRAIKILHGIGSDELAVALYAELAQKLTDTVQLDALGAMAAEHQNARAVLAVGKSAVQRGYPLDLHAYPSFGIPAYEPVGDQVEQAMVYAIARQESAFNPKAISTAGARGLMQLMPATAKRTAQRFGVGFDAKRLLEDPAYNAKIGSAHLGELMEDWKGSHILAFASYNAGGGNVRKWITAYGDPRSPRVDRVDWIERIPFSETRNYVQRVLENLNVYRRRLEAGAAAGLDEPLRRAGETLY